MALINVFISLGAGARVSAALRVALVTMFPQDPAAGVIVGGVFPVLLVCLQRLHHILY